MASVPHRTPCPGRRAAGAGGDPGGDGRLTGSSRPDLFHPLCAPFHLRGTNGEAVVLIHGFTGVPAHFRPLGEYLHQHGYTVVAPLLAGHGTSIDDMSGTGAGDWMASAAQAVETVANHRRIHLVGLSMGGLISILLAKSTAAATITTINSPVIVHDLRLYLAPLMHRRRPRVIWPDRPPPRLDDEVSSYWLTYPGFPTRTGGDLVRLSWLAIGAATRLRRPALVIQTRTDEAVFPVSGAILARALGPRCRLVWLTRSIHNSLLDSERDVIHRAVLARVSS